MLQERENQQSLVCVCAFDKGLVRSVTVWFCRMIALSHDSTTTTRTTRTRERVRSLQFAPRAHSVGAGTRDNTRRGVVGIFLFGVCVLQRAKRTSRGAGPWWSNDREWVETNEPSSQATNCQSTERRHPVSAFMDVGDQDSNFWNRTGF